ncbi:hypothetical protein AWC31_25820 [Mycolicibacterium wolinskyi]|uniref:Uncharacterized protein n=2 Tax=Mycobacteriaceae TaxID=1762 RepID=A0A1X2F875_9MYCO|nr:hypothetical protein AWC31_25820 [Mycolicibacterium wolinskyi]
MKDRIVAGAAFIGSLYVTVCVIWFVIATNFDLNDGVLAGGGIALLGFAIAAYVNIYREAIGARTLTRKIIARAVSLACVAVILVASVDISISDHSADSIASSLSAINYDYYHYYTYGYPYYRE